MAFYTVIGELELQALLERYGIGELSSCVGVSDGIENTTYILTADSQQWILTLFEDLSAIELPFFVRLMTWLHEQKLPVACPLIDKNGQTLQSLSGKPALLFPRLPGQHPYNITAAHCAVIGAFLGRMHAVSANYPEQRANPRGTEWMQQARQRLDGFLNTEDVALLDMQIANAKNLRTLPMPQGLIHGDLFHDNALFINNNEQLENEKLCGVIDFYNACSDILAFDLAIVINDWCALPDGGVDAERAQTLLAAYNAQRPMTELENEHWKIVLQLAATRFWLSRLLAEKLPARPDVNHPHKPSSEYHARLLHHLM